MTGKSKQKPRTRKPTVLGTVTKAKLQPQEVGLFDTVGLMEGCRTKWQYGDWIALAAFGKLEIGQDPDRGKIAALVAAAHGQLGDLDQARKYIGLALGWNCSREHLAQVMISSVENSLGRAALQLGAEDQAINHFQLAVSLVEPKADSALLAQTRQIREMARSGMLQQAKELVEHDLLTVQQERESWDISAWSQAMAERSAILSQTEPPLAVPAEPQEERQAVLSAPLLKNPLFDEAAFRYYGGTTGEMAANFIHIETKSLPRSGLHYLRNTLKDVLDQAFSFCEWYNEPGCCHRIPCAMTGYAETSGFHLRLLKSHDFEMADPITPVTGAMQRLVLIRDPLQVLTSWWILHLLELNHQLMSDHGIVLTKIYYQHEKPVIQQAHRLLETHARMPSSGVLRSWLHQKTAYIIAFMQKWENIPDTQIVDYTEMPQVVLDLLQPWEETLDEGAQRRLTQFRKTGLQKFTPRSSAFSGPGAKITTYLEDHAHLFQDAVARILEVNSSGRLAGAIRTEST